MADFHAADLWVAVVPETSQVGPAMEQAGKEAKGKFGDAVKGIGKNIHDEFTDVGKHAKDAFGKAGKTAGEIFSSEIGKELTNTAAKEIGAALGDAVRDLPGVARGVELFQQWGSASKVAAGGLQGVADAMHNARAGDFAGALEGVDRALKSAEPVAKLFGQDISGWQRPLGDVLDKAKPLTDDIDRLKGNIHDTVDGLKTFTNNAPQFAGAFEMIGKAAGPVAITLATISALDKNFAGDLNKLLDGLKSHDPSKIASGGGGMMWNSLKDYSTLFGLAPMPWQHQGESSSQHTWTYWPGFKGAPTTPDPLLDLPYPEHFIGPIPKGAVRAPGGVAPPTPSPSPSAGGGSVYKDWYGHGANWDAIAGPEAGGNWQIDHGEGPDVTGGLQIATQTWLANGGGKYAPKAFMATPEQQKTIGDRILATQGPGAWPTTSKNHPDWFKGGSGSGVGAIGSDSLNLDTIPLAAQKYANDCIDASARIILSHSGVNMTEDQLKGVIAPGGTIESQAAGLNRLYPAGRFMAMAGSGGSQAAMFKAIKASIDQGVGSILNVAPGSSIAGHNFPDGHFIAATGYNPDGTINLSDTARGTRYSVSAADAFQATRGRGIVAGTGSGPGAGSGGASGPIPTGAEHDPLYVTAASSGGGSGGGSPFQSQGQQLGQGLLGGIMQSIGLDGSVFGGKSPLDWGAVKLGGGLLNYGMGLMNNMSPGRGGGGGLGGLAGLIPGPGAAISASAGPGGGSFGIGQQVGGGGGPTTVHNDNSVSVTTSHPDPYAWLQAAQFQQNGYKAPGSSNRFNLSPVPVGP